MIDKKKLFTDFVLFFIVIIVISLLYSLQSIKNNPFELIATYTNGKKLFNFLNIYYNPDIQLNFNATELIYNSTKEFKNLPIDINGKIYTINSVDSFKFTVFEYIFGIIQYLIIFIIIFNLLSKFFKLKILTETNLFKTISEILEYSIIYLMIIFIGFVYF